jgi:carbonic anhydrase
MFISKFQQTVFTLSFIVFAFIYSSANAAASPSNNPSEVLSKLLDGNRRFIKEETQHPSYHLEAKNKLLEKQMPIAVIVGCSDSRVPPELIFDRGLGELFVVRVAGNVIGPIEMDSVEFAVERLKVPLVMVVGHQNCGAVQAALSGRENVPELESIYPLIDSALKNCDTIGSNALVDAIQCNVKKGVTLLKNSPTIAPYIAQKKVQVMGAYFDFETGKISVISDSASD